LFRKTKHQLLLLCCFLAVSCAHPIKKQHVQQSTAYLSAHVVRISEEYANINTDVSEETLVQYGITHQSTFAVKYRGQMISALLGKSYSDVPKGDWIALIEEDGNLQLALSFGHAATELGCVVGDTLYIEKPDHKD